MKIAIAGAGAIGCHYGGMLRASGFDVVFLARGAHLEALRQAGLRHTSLEWERCLELMVSDNPAIAESCDVVLFTCKTTGLVAMCRQLAGHVAEGALLATLQNGVEAPDIVAAHFPGHEIIAGSAFIGARIEAPGHVVHAAAGHLRLGIWREDGGDAAARLEELVALFCQAGVDARTVKDVRQLLWNKMIWNCGFNAITALTRRYARDIAGEAETAGMALAAMRETAAVARALGVNLLADAAERQLEITKSVGQVKTSMWQDIEQARPTEIEAMNGYVASAAERLGLEAPVNRMLAILVRALEQG